MADAKTMVFVNQTREQALLDFQRGVLGVKTENMTVLEAVAAYTESKNMEPEDAAEMLSPKLLKMITEESKALRLIK